MFGKLIFLFTLMLALPACANPNYASPGRLDDGQNKEKTTACQAQFDKSEFCVSYEWETMPTRDDVGSFIFKFFRLDQNGAPILEDRAGKIAVVLWMPSMGHGSSPVTVDHQDVGTYRASNVYFSMRGRWEIRFQIKDGNEVQDQAIIPISL